MKDDQRYSFKPKAGSPLRMKGLVVIISLAFLLSTPMVFAQEETVSQEFIDFGGFWVELFESWASIIAENTINVLSFFIVLIVTWFVGRAVNAILARFLKKIFKSKELEKADLNKVKEGWTQVTSLIPFTAKWFVYIYGFVIAIDLLGFTQASQWLGVLWTYIPNIIAFIILIVVGIIGSRIALKWMEEYKPELFGQDGKAKFMKAIVNAIIYALIFGIGITQLGIGEDIIPIIYWTVIAGIMGIAIACAVGLRHIVTTWSYGEALKNQGLIENSKIKFGNVEGIVISTGITHTKIKVAEEVKLIPNETLHKEEITIKKEAESQKHD